MVYQCTEFVIGLLIVQRCQSKFRTGGLTQILSVILHEAVIADDDIASVEFIRLGNKFYAHIKTIAGDSFQFFHICNLKCSVTVLGKVFSGGSESFHLFLGDTAADQMTGFSLCGIVFKNP